MTAGPLSSLGGRPVDYTPSFVHVVVTAHAPDLLLLCLLALGECLRGTEPMRRGLQRDGGGVTRADGDAFILNCESIEFHLVQCCELVMLEL